MKQESENPNGEWDGGEPGVSTATLPPATQAPSAVTDEPLPSDYKSLMALHQKLYRSIPLEKSRGARAKLTARHNAVKGKLAAMQNGPAAPPIGASENALVDAGRRNRHVHRASRLENLRAAKAAFEADPEYFLKIEAKPLRPVSAVITWLLKQNPVLHSIAWIRQILVTYELQRLENFNLTHPVERIAEINEQLATCTDAGVIEKLQSESATLGLPTALVTARNSRISLQNDWQAVEEANYRLLQCCLMELQRAREESLQAERMLFETHPLKLSVTETPAAKAWDSPIQQVTQLLEAPATVPVRQLAGAPPATFEHTALTALLHLGVLDDE